MKVKLRTQQFKTQGYEYVDNYIFQAVLPALRGFNRTLQESINFLKTSRVSSIKTNTKK